MMVNLVIGCMLLVVFVAQANSIQLCRTKHEPCFSYDRGSSYGPSCWYALHNSHCCDESGSLQSPIDIPSHNRWFNSNRRLRYVEAEEDEWCDGDDDNGYCYNRNLKLKGRLENNGVYPTFIPDHPVALINVPSSTMPAAARGQRYILASIHFHIGKKGDYRQTENLINGKSFDAEAHIVHYREDLGGAEEAKNHTGGIVVISIFLSATEGKRSSAFWKIFRHLHEVIKFDDPGNACKNITNSPGNNTECTHDETLINTEGKCRLHSDGGGHCGKPKFNIKFNPNDLLSKTPKYLVFDGGLTSPTCSESVIWMVAKNPTRINNLVPLVLAMLETYSGVTIGTFGNLRPLQNVAGREVTLVKFRKQRVCKDDDDDDDDCENECECECENGKDDDGRECNEDDCKCDDDGHDDDDSDDVVRRNSMKLNWSMNWRGNKYERGNNIDKMWK